jgi:hypothetical protein
VAPPPHLETCLNATLDVLQPLLVAMDHLDNETTPAITEDTDNPAVPDAARARPAAELEQLLVYGMHRRQTFSATTPQRSRSVFRRTLSPARRH